MKKTKRLVPILLSVMMGVFSATSFVACDKDKGGEKEQSVKVNTISASLLDGKVANLMSANGIAIQDKTENEPTVSAMKTKMSHNMIVAHAEDDMI